MQLCTQAALSFNFKISLHMSFSSRSQTVLESVKLQFSFFFFSLFQTNFRDDVDNVFPVYVVK